MKKLKKIVAGAMAAALTLSLGGMLMACSGAGVYTFEAEDALLEGEGITIETGPVYSKDGDSDVEVTIIGNFAGDKTITWTVNASAECDAELTLHAASAAMAMGGVDWSDPENIDWSKLTYSILEITGESAAVSITNNDGEAMELEGTLPGLESLNMQDSTHWKNMGTLTGTIHLVKGENKIVLSIGTVAGAINSGLNVDKLVLDAPTKLTFTKTDNSELLPDEDDE